MTNSYKSNVIKGWFRISDRKEAHKRLKMNWKINNIFSYAETGSGNEIDANDMFLWRLCRFWYVTLATIKGYTTGKNKIKQYI